MEHEAEHVAERRSFMERAYNDAIEYVFDNKDTYRCEGDAVAALRNALAQASAKVEEDVVGTSVATKEQEDLDADERARPFYQELIRKLKDHRRVAGW